MEQQRENHRTRETRMSAGLEPKQMVPGRVVEAPLMADLALCPRLTATRAWK